MGVHSEYRGTDTSVTAVVYGVYDSILWYSSSNRLLYSVGLISSSLQQATASSKPPSWIKLNFAYTDPLRERPQEKDSGPSVGNRLMSDTESKIYRSAPTKSFSHDLGTRLSLVLLDVLSAILHRNLSQSVDWAVAS